METSKIALKMTKAMAAIDAVAKRGRNTVQNYQYVKAADVANEVRAVLCEVGIAFTYDVLSERYWEAPTKNGGIQYFCSLHVAVTFTDIESGESFTARVIGWGADSQDKAPYKAMTGALKYALRMNFLIPDENDPENEAPQDQRPTPSPQQVQAAQARTPPPVSGPKISEPQAKRFYAIAKNAGKNDSFIKSYLAKLGIDKTLDMPRAAYEQACKWAEAETVPTPPDPADNTFITDDDIPF